MDRFLQNDAICRSSSTKSAKVCNRFDTVFHPAINLMIYNSIYICTCRSLRNAHINYTEEVVDYFEVGL